MRKIFTFTLPQITCAACIEPVQNVLKHQRWVFNPEGTQIISVIALEINVLRKIFNIEVESEGVDDKAIKKHIIQELDDIGTEAGVEPPHKLKAALGIIGGIAFLVMSMLGGGMPFIASAIVTGISTLLTLYVGKEILIEAYQKITRLHTLDMNALFSVSALIAVTVSIASLFVPWLPCMLEAGLLTFGFRHLGIVIEDSAKNRVIDSVSFQERAPDEVEILVDENHSKTIKVKELQPGDVIRINSGATIPINGVCLSENAQVEASIMNGSFLPKTIAAGEAVVAGMKVKSLKPMDIKVTATAANSFLAQLDKAILKAESSKAPLEATSQTALKYFVPALFVFGAAIAGMAGMMFGAAMAIKCLVTLLVSACPCTLGTVVPLAVTVALGKASQEGVMFRSGMALQTAGNTDTVIFDLNGTLTEGNYDVETIAWQPSVESTSQTELLHYLYELEKEADHPIGVAIQQYLKKHIISSRAAIHSETLPNTSNSGRKLCINSENYYVGNRTMMIEQGIALTNHPVNTTAGTQQIFFAKENVLSGEKTLLATINVNDPLKKSAKEVIDTLKAMGKDIHICTGADKLTALNYAATLKIPAEKVRAACVAVTDSNHPPENSKIAYIHKLKKDNPDKVIAMIGDALNDALPLKACDLGVLVKSQASADMMESDAQVIIQNTSLKPLLASFEIGNSMVQNIHQNLQLSFSYNFATLGLISCFACCAGLILSPGIGVMLMIGQASLVLLNVYRFKQLPVLYTQAGGEAQKPAQFNNTELHKNLGITKAPTVVSALSSAKPAHPVLSVESNGGLRANALIHPTSASLVLATASSHTSHTSSRGLSAGSSQGALYSAIKP